ncbi:MAG: hypothetical protein GYB67_04515 [Chloroflexi bacterium]|nr:hypothetical protein [Chloroflexota bacterium]
MPDRYDQMNLVEGVNAFQSARINAFWDEVISLVRGKPAELLSFEDIRTRLRLREENYRGLHDVPLDQIAGSVGRYRDFTSRFLPKSNKMQERWSRIYAQASGMTGLPPIELYKVGDVYFVRDGNHRVSVARRLGAKTIQAHVTELPTSIALRPGMTRQELDSATAYAQFLDVTGLKRTRPHLQPITLTEPTRYDDLMGHIHLHAAVMEDCSDCPIELEKAAADWYDNVYRPAVTLIRKYKVMRHAPGRTEGDLYLWMIDHLREVKEQMGDHPQARSLSDALVDYLAKRRISVPKDLLYERDSSVQLTRSTVEAQLNTYRTRLAAEQAAAPVPAGDHPPRD